MRHTQLTILLVLLSAMITQAQNKDNTKVAYIVKYKQIAVQEMERTGVPASIKLAQGLLESDAGRSELATKAHNHFGIKCGKIWDGAVFYKEDDDYDENGKLIKSCFRKYRKPEESYVAHSEFLRDPSKVNRYGSLFKLETTDYKAWANGLRQAGYATNPNYPALLINIIENYQLNEFDKMGAVDIDTKKTHRGTSLINNVKVVITKNNMSLADVIEQNDVKLKCIRKYNEKLLAKPTDVLPDNTKVYLQKKHRFFRGRQKYHYVKESDNMYSISQLYGIRLYRLYKKNRIPEGSEPAVGQKIKLRGCVKKKDIPKLREKSVEMNIDTKTGLPQKSNTTGTTNTNTTPTTQPNSGGVVTPPSANPTKDDGMLDMEITPGGVSVPSQQDTTTKPTTNTTNNNGNSTTVDDNSPKPDASNTNAIYYKVVAGDTLFGIAKKYNTTVEKILALNQMANTNIKIGQMLRVK